ncbi:MAG: N-acetylmuramoyl-L-alanine amidase [Gammaproteobacteria bacterium]|nr:N-acetylmuramoyl-L-alanine amidase [Gammaproteobacteria bacterium]
MSAQAVTVEGLRLWPAPDHTRLVFDLDGPVQHSLFTLADPQRVVIDLNAADITAALPTLSKSSEAVVKDIRYAKRGQTDLRVVLDLSRPVKAKSFSLKPQGEYGYRLVLDLEYDTGPAAPIKSPPKELPMAPHPRDVVIAIDAGHGGDDSGALGRKGTREKDVVLKIAKYLETLVNQQPGMKAVMIRQGDYFISLHQRVEKAREAQADLFVSIHADAFNDRRAKGSSVFVLSEHGASSQVARFLADSENNSDLVGGVSLDDKDDLLKRVLVDMVRNSTIEDSHNIAKYLLKGLRQVNSLHKGRVEQAGFRVLKAPDIPSVLIETAFISNPSEEAKLRNAAHQEGFAKAIFKGIVTYFKQNPPPDTRMAELWQKKQRLAIRDNPSRS